MTRALFATLLLSTALAACGGPSPQDQRSNGMFRATGSTNASVAEVPAPLPADAAVAEEAQAEAEEAEGSPDATSQPGPGSAQRAALMDSLRPAIERELGGPIEFVVTRAAVRDGWAFVIADPQRPGGGAIDPPADFDTEFRDGLTVNGILRFSGGGWTLVDHAIGPTDVWYCGVDGPPRALTGC